MEHNEAKIDSMVLALLYLTQFKHGDEVRSWKSHDWSSLERLHEQGYISSPTSKARSIRMTEIGAKRAKELFEEHFLG